MVMGGGGWKTSGRSEICKKKKKKVCQLNERCDGHVGGVIRCGEV